jgi:hypothetical protein
MINESEKVSDCLPVDRAQMCPGHGRGLHNLKEMTQLRNCAHRSVEQLLNEKEKLNFLKQLKVNKLIQNLSSAKI